MFLLFINDARYGGFFFFLALCIISIAIFLFALRFLDRQTYTEEHAMEVEREEDEDVGDANTFHEEDEADDDE